MKLKPVFTIQDLILKKQNKIDDFFDSKAVITHFLHNYKNGLKKHFQKDALASIKKMLEYKENNEDITLELDDVIQQFLFEVENVPFPTPENYSFKFIDLFAGIGGFRMALQNVGGKCVYTSEWNIDAQKTYQINFGEIPFGDITNKKNIHYIPNKFDILCAGFPCQAFSIAGHQKGFSDNRGTLFFEIEKIIEKHKPKVVFLENVKNLISHDKGNTFKVIINTLQNKLGYITFYQVLNTSTFANIPQNRERIFIVAFDPKQVKNYNKFQFPNPVKLNKTIHDFLSNIKQPENFYYHSNHPYYKTLSDTMISKDTVYQWRRVYARENKNNLCPTLTANMGLGGHNVPLIKDNYGIRRLTPKECFALQGYPMDTYILPQMANSKLYMQAGNSVTTTLTQLVSLSGLELLKLAILHI